MRQRRRLTDALEQFKTAGIRREIPDDFKYNSKKLKHLKHVLHNVTIALGTLTSCLNEFSKLKGPEVSPDGFLGGVGYILPLKEIKQTINSTIQGLSDIADCIADELTNPRWRIKDKEDKEEIEELIKEKDKAIEKVEEEISPDDLVTSEEVENIEEQKTEKSASTKRAENILASAVHQSLVNFYN